MNIYYQKSCTIVLRINSKEFPGSHPNSVVIKPGVKILNQIMNTLENSSSYIVVCLWKAN